jgi:hypothetical protein
MTGEVATVAGEQDRLGTGGWVVAHVVVFGLIELGLVALAWLVVEVLPV